MKSEQTCCYYPPARGKAARRFSRQMMLVTAARRMKPCGKPATHSRIAVSDGLTYFCARHIAVGSRIGAGPATRIK